MHGWLEEAAQRPPPPSPLGGRWRLGRRRPRPRRPLPRQRGWPPRSIGGRARRRARGAASAPSWTPAGARAGARSARLRAGFAGMSALLLVAVVAGVVALDQRNQARRRPAPRPRSGSARRRWRRTRSTARCCSRARASTLEDSVPDPRNLLAHCSGAAAAIGVSWHRRAGDVAPSARMGGACRVQDEERNCGPRRHARRRPGVARVVARGVITAPGLRPHRLRLALGSSRRTVLECDRSWLDIARAPHIVEVTACASRAGANWRACSSLAVEGARPRAATLGRRSFDARTACRWAVAELFSGDASGTFACRPARGARRRRVRGQRSGHRSSVHDAAPSRAP